MTEHWSHRPEGGGRFALGLIVSIARRCGRSVTRLLLYPITLYFFVRRAPERRASHAFFARAQGHPASSWQVLKHIHYFASTILDRVFLLSEAFRRFDVRVHGLDQLDAELARGRGILLLGAHMGSFEVLRVLALRRPEIRVRVVMDPQQTPAMTALLHALNPRIQADVIDARGGGTEVVLALKDAAERGELLAIMADRARPAEPTKHADFFGEPAAFPVAPYLIAAALEVPVVLCFGLYRGGNRYDLHFECMAEHLVIPRRERAERLAELVGHYARRLEHYVRLDPYNWFNFYDFWHCQDDAGSRTDGAVGSESAHA